VCAGGLGRGGGSPSRFQIGLGRSKGVLGAGQLVAGNGSRCRQGLAALQVDHGAFEVRLGRRQLRRRTLFVGFACGDLGAEPVVIRCIPSDPANGAPQVCLGLCEGEASVDGAPARESARRWMSASASVAWPVTDQLTALGSAFLNPPLSSLGVNQTTTLGATLGIRW